MTDNFDAAVAVTLSHEGGYVNDILDPGGETKFGISKAQYPDVDITGLTRAGAEAIYRRDYWDRYRCGDLPLPLALCYFDALVNHSPSNPARWLQAALGVSVDGQVGPRTLAAAKACLDPVAACRDFTVARLEYVKTLPSYPRFGRGWHARYVAVLAEAVRRWRLA